MSAAPKLTYGGRTYTIDTPEKEAAVKRFSSLRRRAELLRGHYHELAVDRVNSAGFTAHQHGTLQVQVLVPAGHILASFADRPDAELTVQCRPYEGFAADLADFALAVPKVAALLHHLGVLCAECKTQIAGLAAEQAACIGELVT